MKRSIILVASVLIASALFIGRANSESTPRESPEVSQHNRITADDAKDTQQHERKPVVPFVVWQPTQTALSEALHTVWIEEEAYEKNHRFQKDCWDKAAIIANWLLVFVGALYTYFAWRQWTAVKEQANIANETLFLQFRPRIVIRHVGLTTVPDNMGATGEKSNHQVQSIEAVVIIANQGGIAAEIIEANITLRVLGCDDVEEIHKSKPLLPQFDRHTGLPVYGDERVSVTPPVIQAGEQRTIKQTMPVSDDVAIAVKEYLATHRTNWNGNPALVVFGFFRYRGSRPNSSGYSSYATGFCRRYDAQQERFLAVEIPDYEYAD